MAARPRPVLSSQPVGGDIIRFGHLLGTHPSNDDNYFDTILAVAQASETAGLDAVFYSDHFQFQRLGRLGRWAQVVKTALSRRVPAPSFHRRLDKWVSWLVRRYDTDPHRTLTILECFTTLAAIAAMTQKIRLGALVAGVPYRNPALLAKINTTLDIISHGRCIVGLGAGWYEEEFKSYGWLFPSIKQRIDRLEDAIQIVDLMMTQRRASYVGKHHQIMDALNNPLPVQQPRPPLMIGGSGEKRTLRLVAQYADYCNILGDPVTVARKLKVLQKHCTAVERPYTAIIRSNFVSILIAQNETELARKRKQYVPWLGHPIIGTPEQVIGQLQAFVDVGIQYIIFNLPDAHTLEPIQLLAETVVPAFAGN
jgi:alkanesulfonate monooxygenase SsuD/methylene tetrahydromethanopterin reductase-like flavin-dependent oxidoreductase (luciferase family)